MRTAILSIKKQGNAPAYVVALHSSAVPGADGSYADSPAGWAQQAWLSNAEPEQPFLELAKEVQLWESSGGNGRRELGGKLFRLLCSTKAGAAWVALSDQGSLRTLLDVDDGLREWPWELVRDDRDALDIVRYLFAGVESPLARFVRRKPRVEGSPWPMRILVVVGPDERKREIHWKQERRALYRLFARHRHDVEARFLDCPSREALKAELTRFKPHVFHFMGHGASAGAGQGELLLGTPADKQEWSAAQIKVDLDEQELCCAVLNACGTAQGEAALAVANSFLGSARAVVAMGSDVEGASAAIFAGEFYENVFANRQVESAVAAARRVLLGLGVDSAQWVVPRLFVSHADIEQNAVAFAFQRRSPNTKPEHADVALQEVRYFVDRQLERSKLAEHLCPKAERRAVWLRGERLVGKSLLAKWSLERMHHYQAEARFLDFSDPRVRGLRYVSVLRRIRDGAKGHGNAGEHFGPFNQACNYLLAGQIPPVEIPVAVPKDQGLEYDPDKGTPSDWEDRIGARFTECLKAWAARSPVHLVFDAFQVCEPSVRESLARCVLDPIARGEVPGATIVIASASVLELEARNALVEPVDLQSFDSSKALEILGEYVDLVIEDAQLIEAMATVEFFIERKISKAQTWTGKWFTDLLTAFKAMDIKCAILP